MREVKFRAYTKEYGMQNVRELLWKDDGSIASVSFDSGISVLTNRGVGKDIVVEQYTGMTDKNGLEIYEGDIVSFKSEMVDFKVIAKTVYLNEIAGFVFRTKEIDYEPEDMYEVIGNIHENPELLEVEK